VFRLAQEMQAAGVVPTLEAMNNVIRAYLASGLSHKALKAFSDMEKYNIAPNIFTMNYVVEVWLCAPAVCPLYSCFSGRATEG
jgi:pentatricopeptide repeat protein